MATVSARSTPFESFLPDLAERRLPVIPHQPQLVQHRMSWWDAFCLGYGLGLGLLLSQVMVLGVAALLVAVMIAAGR